MVCWGGTIRAGRDITVAGLPAGFARDLIAEVRGGQLVKSMGKETWRAGSCLEVEQANRPSGLLLDLAAIVGCH